MSCCSNVSSVPVFLLTQWNHPQTPHTILGVLTTSQSRLEACVCVSVCREKGRESHAVPAKVLVWASSSRMSLFSLNQ